MFAMNPDSTMVAMAALAWVLFGVVILLVVRCMPVTDVPLSRSFGRLFFVVLAWVFIIVGLIVSLTVIGLMILVVIGTILARRQRARQQALLWTLAVAAERGVPLVPAVDAFAAERWGLASQEARVLARLLSSGLSLPDALSMVGSAVGGLVPRDAIVPIHVGQELGALPEGLRQATAPTGTFQSVWDQLAGKLAYLCAVVVFAAVVVTFMVLKIAPAFQKIFQDFGADLPPLSKFGMFLWPATFGPFLFLGCIFLVFIFFYAILRYIGVITFDLPLMSRITRKLHAARILESLAMAAQRNQPFPKTIATMARCYPKWSIRWRLHGVLVDITTGMDFAESLRMRGLVSAADVAVLHAAQRAGNLAWAMREIADGNRRRLAYRLQAWLQVLFPAAIVSFGVVVMMFYLSYFVPLLALIQKLS
jgi:type II secretory pathway component PulF